MSIEIAALNIAMAALLKNLSPIVNAYISKKKSPNLVLKSRGIEIPLSADTLKKLDTQQLQNLAKLITQSDAKDVGTFTLSRYAATDAVEEPSAAPGAAGIALALGKEAVFRDARRRIELVFKLNLGVAIILAIILLMGIGGAVFSAVFLQRSIWAATFGGVAAADIIGLYVFKPLTAINTAIVSSQRLDTVHLRLSEQLNTCSQYENLKDRIDCQTTVWDTVQKEMAGLSK